MKKILVFVVGVIFLCPYSSVAEKPKDQISDVSAYVLSNVTDAVICPSGRFVQLNPDDPNQLFEFNQKVKLYYKGELWTLAPGEAEKQNRRAVERERVEQQQKAAEERASYMRKELDLKERAVKSMEQAASRPTIIVKPQPRDYIAVDPQTGKAISVIPID